MALNITNERVESKAIQIAGLLGSNKTAAVERALDEFLQRHNETAKQNAGNDLTVQFAELAALPVLDDRGPDEILGYDDHGLP